MELSHGWVSAAQEAVGVAAVEEVVEDSWGCAEEGLRSCTGADSVSVLGMEEEDELVVG